MPKISGRMLVVLIVTAMSIYFVYPTLSYFHFIRSLSSPPTEAQEKEKRHRLADSRLIKLGLDLQGGADFLLAVDTDFQNRQSLEGTAEKIKQSLQNEKVKATVKAVVESSQITVKLGDTKDAKVARNILDNYVKARQYAWPDETTLEKSGDATLTQMKEAREQEAAQSVDAALETIRRRIGESGLTQPEVAKQGSDRIRVKVPGEADPKRVRDTLLKTAYLEFRLLPADHDRMIQPFIKPGSMGPGGTGVVRDELIEEVKLPNSDQKERRLKKDIPGVPDGWMLALGQDKRMDKKTNAYTVREDLVYLVKSGNPNVSGKTLRHAQMNVNWSDFEDPVCVSLEFNNEGRIAFGETTKDNVGNRFAILIDGKVISAPNIKTAIMDGQCQITGGYSQQEAADFSLVLRSGSLPAPLRVIEENSVGASLGNDSIAKSGEAVVIGGVLLVIMMVGIYSTAGAIAVLAMALNVLLILAILSLANATLTLSGVGGVLLTMGMAVDANVLIYERLREELKSGKPLRVAMNAAFSRAFTVIFDSHVTALLPAIVLILFEVVSGSVRGFWTALAMGLIANLYTGLTVTRAFIEAWVEKRKGVSLGKFHPFQHVNVDWIGKRHLGLYFSFVLMGLCVLWIGVKGVNPGIDFTGGVLTTVEIQGGSTQKLRDAFTAKFHEARVQDILNTNDFQITVPFEKGAAKLSPSEAASHLESLKKEVAETVTTLYPGKAKILSSQSVESTVGGEFQLNALLTVTVASLVILAYLAFRFQTIYGLGAVLALVHDVLVTLGIFLFLGKSLTLDIVSALLIILGYSVSDTIVVFDRVRETMGESTSSNLKDIFNSAINRTLSRTVLTSCTVVLSSVVLYLFGGSALKDFSLVLTMGFTFGTYSSVFVASALAYDFLTRKAGSGPASPDRVNPARQPRKVVAASN